jgi:hypothetical protein
VWIEKQENLTETQQFLLNPNTHGVYCGRFIAWSNLLNYDTKVYLHTQYRRVVDKNADYVTEIGA